MDARDVQFLSTILISRAEFVLRLKNFINFDAVGDNYILMEGNCLVIIEMINRIIKKALTYRL